MFIFFFTQKLLSSWCSHFILIEWAYSLCSTVHFHCMIHPIIFSRRAKTSCQRATPKTLISLTSIWQISSLTPFHHNRFLSFHFSCPLSTGRELSTLPTSSSFSGPLSISEPDEDQETLINKSLKLKVRCSNSRNKTHCHNKWDWQTVEPWRGWCVNVTAMDSLLHHS